MIEVKSLTVRTSAVMPSPVYEAGTNVATGAVTSDTVDPCEAVAGATTANPMFSAMGTVMGMESTVSETFFPIGWTAATASKVTVAVVHEALDAE